MDRSSTQCTVVIGSRKRMRTNADMQHAVTTVVTTLASSRNTDVPAHAPSLMNSLRIYNTLARDKQLFVPLRAGEVRMYVCGITVYDYCHVGHARMMIVFDIVQRWLRTLGYNVTYVRNITDIDDKIIRRAVENGETIKSLTDRFIAALHEDADALGIQRPDIEPRATDFIPQMLGMIETLEANGN